MVTTYIWAELRNHAIQVFNGDHPGAALEDAILHHFEREPTKVATAIDQIGRQVANGKIRSGWAILDRELNHQTPNVVATDNAERAKQLQLAETWIRNTGGNLDRPEEVEAELFDPHLGKLRHWPETRDQILALWTEQRHRFTQTDAEAIERMAHQAATLKRLRKASRGALTHESADAHAERVMAEIERARLAYLETLAPDNESEM